MPRAPELSLRLTIAEMVSPGAGPPEIARRLDLPVSTARDLARRAAHVPPEERLPTGMAPRYGPAGDARGRPRLCWRMSWTFVAAIPVGEPSASGSS